MYEGVIYKYTNKINGKIYIGQTINEKRRLNQHKKSSENSLFHRAIKKYGWENFEYKVLFKIHCNNEQDLTNTLNIKESIAIRFFNSIDSNVGYNLKISGSKGKLNKSVRDKISKSHKGLPGRKHTDEEKKSLSIKRRGVLNPMYGIHRPHTEEEKIKMSIALKGKYVGPKNLNFGKKRKPLSNEVKNKLSIANSIPVVQLSIEGDFIKEWVGAKKAENDLKLKGITKACKGKAITVGGFRWMYKSEYESNDYELKSTEKFNIRGVVQLDLDCEVVNTFKSISEASAITKINYSNIRSFLNPNIKSKTAGGYRWIYNDNFQNLIKEGKDIKNELMPPTISQLDENGDLVKHWLSISQAAKELNISGGIIRRSIKLGGLKIKKLNNNRFIKYGTD